MLPIEEIKPQIQQILSQPPQKPLIVSAPTGSGKSTRLPLWLDEMTDRLVVVVEPRRVACRALATYLSSLRDESVGESIGYSVRFEDRTSAQTRVLFVTPGVALRLLQPGGRLASLDNACVLIDEFHERGWETDLLAALLLERFRRDPFVFAITSATLDIQSLQTSMDASFFEASGRSYPVDVRYMTSGHFAPTREGIADHVTSAVRSILASDDDGDVLVFLPGKGEIRTCADRLNSLKKTHQLQIFSVHSGIPLSELSRVLSARQGNQRRIFLATNIAETSLTIPGITWVVDTGLVRMRMHRGGHTALSLVPTSQASMDQRAGRAGRVAPGTCIRLWDEHYAPQSNTSPEVERIDLDEVILRAAACGLNALQFSQAPWIAKPPVFAVDEAVKTLTNIGAFDVKGELTSFGKKLSKLPVSVYEARMLAETPPHLHHTMADLVAILQRGKRLLLPLDMRDEQRRKATVEARQALFDGCQDDISVTLRLLREGHPGRHGVNASGLKETRQIAHSLRKLLNAKLPAPHKDADRVDDRQALIKHLLRHTPESAFVLRKRALKDSKKAPRRKSSSQPWANGTIEVLIDAFEPFQPKDKPQRAPMAGIVLDHIWLGDASGTGTRARGNFLLPCSYQDLVDADLGEVQVHSYTINKKRRICGMRERTIAQVNIESQLVPLRGRELCVAVAHLTMEGRWFKGVADQLSDRHHLWRLLSQWERTLETEHWMLDKIQSKDVPDVLDHLIETLSDLGVQSQSDLQLVEHEDILPDIAAMSGIYEHELEELLQDFPRIWTYQGAKYLCTPNPKAKKVVIEPANKATRKAKEPSAKHLPRFRGYRVIYKQASRSLTLR